MGTLALNLHVHTRASFDSFIKPTSIINYAEKKGLNIIAITDHNSIDNALRIKEITIKQNNGIKVIVGEEISTDKGEVIGLFLERFVKPGKLHDVINDIKSQGGLVYLPHPFKRSEIVKSNYFDSIDMIEVFNSRCSYEQNYKALLLALNYNKFIGCGSDAHLISEIGKCRMELKINNLDLYSIELDKTTFLKIMENTQEIKIVGSSESFITLESLSQLIKCIKLRKLSPIKYLIKFIISETFASKNTPNYFDVLLKIEDIICLRFSYKNLILKI